MNNSLCLPTTGRPQIKAGCVYYTDDQLLAAEMRKRYSSLGDSDLRAVGVYNLMDGTVRRIDALGKEQRSFYPPPVWRFPLGVSMCLGMLFLTKLFFPSRSFILMQALCYAASLFC